MGIAAARHRLFFVEKLSSVGQTWSVQFLESQLLQAGSDWHWVHLRLLSSFLQAEQACEQRDALSPLWMLACGGVFIAPGGGWPCSGSQPAKRARVTSCARSSGGVLAALWKRCSFIHRR